MSDWQDIIASNDSGASALGASSNWRRNLGQGGDMASQLGLPNFDDMSSELGLPEFPSAPSGGGGAEPELSPEQENLSRAQSQVDRDQRVAQSIDADNPSGEAPEGILNTAFDYLNRPLSAVVGGLSAAADIDMSAEDEQEVQGVADRIMAGLSGERDYGVGDIPAMDVDDDAGIAERALKFGGAFAGDVALDPLTYLSFGGTVLGKRAGSEIVQRSVRDKATRELGEESLEGFARQAPAFRAADEGMQVTDDLAERAPEIREGAEAALEEARQTPPTWAPSVGGPENRLGEIGAKQFGDRAAEAYVRGGPTGLRSWMRESAENGGAGIGDDVGERMFSELPRDVQGGLRIRVPFSRSGPGGTPTTFGVGGGGRAAEAVGLDPALQGIHRLRNRVRGVALARGVMDRMSGSRGDLWGQLVRDTSKMPPESLARHTYSHYRVANDLRTVEEATSEDMLEASRGALAQAEDAIRNQGVEDEDAAMDAFRRWFNDKEALDDVMRESTWVDGDLVTGPRVDGLPAEERAGITAANVSHLQVGAAYRQMQDAGVDVGFIDQYVPRILDQEEMMRKAREKPTRPSQSQGGQPSQYTPEKERQQYVEAFTEVDEAGNPNLRTRWLSPEEANERSGRNVFQTNPMAVVGAYSDAARKVATRTKLANTLREHGMTAGGGAAWQRRVIGQPLDELAESLNVSADRLPSQLSQLRQTEVGRLDRLRQEVETARQRVSDAQRRAGQADAELEAEGLVDTAEAEAARVQAQARLDDALRQSEEAGQQASRAASDQMEVASRIEQIDRDIAQAATDRDRLHQLAQSIWQVDDVDQRFEQVDQLVKGLSDFHRRLSQTDRQVAEQMADASEQRLMRQSAQQADSMAQRAETLGKRMRTGKENNTAFTQWLDDQGLQPIGTQDPDLNPTDVTKMPAELDMQYAPEVMRTTVEKYFRASRPNETVQDWIDKVYRPWFGLFKLFGTVGRGPGYHARNGIGGLWQNYLRDVSPEDHMTAGRLLASRKQAWDEAVREEGEKVAARTGLSFADAQKRIPKGRAEVSYERKLADQLSDQMVDTAHGQVSLWDIHKASEMHDVGWKNSKVMEAFHDLTSRTGRQAGTTGETATAQGGGVVDPGVLFARPGARPAEAQEAPANLWPGADEDDLNMVQQFANRLADNAWVDMNKTWAAKTEDFIRNAAFVRGAREYGMSDGGSMAQMLSRGLHFDYQDLSDFEQQWMRGTLVPFYVWTRNNIPLQFRAMFKEPGKMNRIDKVRDNAGQFFAGDNDEELVPSWMQERFGFPTMLGWKETNDNWLGYELTTDGSGNPILAGVESPAYDLNQFIRLGGQQDVTERMRPITRMLSPAVSTPMELMSGTSSFTGAPFSDRGVEAPVWYRGLTHLLPGEQTWQGEEGVTRAAQGPVNAISNMVPPLGQFERVSGITQQKRERLPSTLASQLFAAPAATLSPRQEAGELRARSRRLRQQINRQPTEADLARDLLDEGWSPEQIRALIERQSQ